MHFFETWLFWNTSRGVFVKWAIVAAEIKEFVNRGRLVLQD
jgi:hypothetical protein